LKSNYHKKKFSPLALLKALPRLRFLEVVCGIEKIGHCRTVERERERERERSRIFFSSSLADGE
jgi:hypothetical protein